VELASFHQIEKLTVHPYYKFAWAFATEHPAKTQCLAAHYASLDTIQIQLERLERAQLGRI